MDDDVSRRNAAQLEALVEDTSALSAVLKRRIKALERQAGQGRDGQIKKQQVRQICVSRKSGCVLTSGRTVDGASKVQVC